MRDPQPRPKGTALGDNETRFHMLLDTLPFIAWVSGLDGRAQYFNQRFVDYHGFHPGPERPAGLELFYPDDRSRLQTTRRAALQTTTGYILEARLLRHDGVYRWHRIHNKPLMCAGQLQGWLGTAVDIHDVVLANELLEQRVSERTAEVETVNQRLTAEIQQRRQIEEGLRVSEAGYRMLYNRTPMALHSVNA